MLTGGGGGEPHHSDELSCSICTSLCELPVTTSCGHSYCKPCLASWLSQGRASCPNCRASISSTLPAVSITLQSAIEALKAVQTRSPSSPSFAAPPPAASLKNNSAAYEAALGELGSKDSKALLAKCWAFKCSASELLQKIDTEVVVSTMSYAHLLRSDKEGGASLSLRPPPAHEEFTLGLILEEEFEAGVLDSPAELSTNPIFSVYQSYDDLLRWVGCLWPETLRLCDLKESKALCALMEHEKAWGALHRDSGDAWSLVHEYLSREAAVEKALEAANAQLAEAKKLGLTFGSHSARPALLPAAGMKVDQVFDLIWSSIESEEVVRAGLELLLSQQSVEIPHPSLLLCCLIRHMALADIVEACAKLISKHLGQTNIDNLRRGLLASLATGARAHASARDACFGAAFFLVQKRGERSNAVKAGWPALCVEQPIFFDGVCSAIMAEISASQEERAALEAAGAIPAVCKMLSRSANVKIVCANVSTFVENVCSDSVPSRPRALNDGGMGELLVAARKEHGLNVNTALSRLGRDSEGKVLKR
jgi:hypothetical protein